MARRAYNRRQVHKGRNAWNPPAIFSWSQWTSSLWTLLLLQGNEDRIVLNRAQENMLWRDIIRSDEAADAMTPDAALAAMAQSAMQLLGRFHAVPMLRRSSALTTDTQAFARWATEFLRRCERGRWLSASLLESELAQHVAAKHLELPSGIELVNFPEPQPSRRLLLESIDDAGTQVDVTSLAGGTDAVAFVSAVDEDQEFDTAAQWLRARMDANPDGEFALVTSVSNATAEKLYASLRDALAPESWHAAATPGKVPWECPPEERLASVGSMTALLDVLAWMRSGLSMDRITGVLLCSAFQAGPLDERAQFDVAVLHRETLLRPELDLRSVLHLSRREAYDALSHWLAALAKESDRIAAMPPRQSYATWTSTFRRVADVSGWTKAEGAHREKVDSLQRVFDLAATLDFSGTRVTFGEALEAVGRLTAEAAAWTNPDARLHMVSLAEAASLPLDGALVMQATEEALQPASRPHTLLDWNLQRASHMPGTDRNTDHAAAAATLEQILLTASTLCFSAHPEDSETAPRFAQRISQLAGQEFAPQGVVNLAASSEDDLTEVLLDEAPLPPLPARKVRGGARVLQLQAACGFQAFAEIRLGSRSMNSPTPGFDAAESGSVLHRVLDAFWADVKTQRTLRSMTELEREEAIRAAVDEGVSHRVRLRDEWDRQYLSVQKERMRRVLRRWLDLELERSPFVVQARESKAEVLVGPLELEVRLDRLDVLEDGGVVFIDYKTGASASPAAWEGDRPDQPQLPLYSLLAEPEELRGLAFAKIRAGKSMQWTGYAADETIFPRKGTPVHDLAYDAATWRSTLAALAARFAAGDSSVAPKSYADNCVRCAQRLLCRLDVAALTTTDDSEEPEDE